MGRDEFEDLLATFSQLLQEHALSRPRRRALGGGVKGVLDSPAKKLFFVLFYLKVYPTFDVLGALFAKPRGRNCEAVHLLLPLLEKTLGRKCGLPVRRIRSMEEHAIGGMKRYGAMSQVWRNKIGRLDDRVAVVSASLWNHLLECRRVHSTRAE